MDEEGKRQVAREDLARFIESRREPSEMNQDLHAEMRVLHAEVMAAFDWLEERWRIQRRTKTTRRRARVVRTR